MQYLRNCTNACHHRGNVQFNATDFAFSVQEKVPRTNCFWNVVNLFPKFIDLRMEMSEMVVVGGAARWESQIR